MSLGAYLLVSIVSISFFWLTDWSSHDSVVHTVLKELEDEARDTRSILNQRGQSRRQELLLLVRNLEEVLKDLDSFIHKYQRHTRRERRIYNQLKLATEDLTKYRNKLTFNITAINAFMESLSRGTLAQIEVVLLELVREVREGRRPPSIASIDEKIDNPVWKELEVELAEDGISSTDVSKHKLAIKVFLQNLLSSSQTDALSLDEVASMVESRADLEDAESLFERVPDLSVSSREAPGGPTTPGDERSSMLSDGTSQYESAPEDFHEEINPASPDAVPRISFAASMNSRDPAKTKDTMYALETIDKRLEHLMPALARIHDVFCHRRSVDASTVGPRQMVLMLDPTHSCKQSQQDICSSLTGKKPYPNLRMHTSGL